MENLSFEKNYYDEVYAKLINDENNNLALGLKNIDLLIKNFKSLNMNLKNRFCITNYYDELFDRFGNINNKFFEFFIRLSKSNIGLICSSGINVESNSNNFSELNQNIIADKIKDIHSAGSKLFLSLKTNLGRISKFSHSLFLTSSSLNREYYAAKNICLPISDSRCKKIARLFSKSVKFAKKSGFDGVVIDGSISNIIGEFASDEFNRRIFGKFSDNEDMPKIILENINKKVKNYPIIYKITANTFLKDIFENNDLMSLKRVRLKTQNKIFEFMSKLVGYGVDGFIIEFGTKENEFLNQYSPYLGFNLFSEFYNDLEKFFKDNNIKNKFSEDILLICSDNFSNEIKFNENSKVIFEITKEIYSDLNFINNMSKNLKNKHCLRCGICKQASEEKRIVECTINPELNYEFKTNLPLKNKKIAVVGAGTSGIVVSNIIAKRVGNIDLFEVESKINKNGRSCEIFGSDIFLNNFNNYIENELIENINKNLIDLKLNQKFIVDYCKSYETIIIATGFKELFLGVPGAVLKSVVSIFDILNRKLKFENKKHIVIYAKSELALKLAIYLAKNKHDVCILINDYNFLLKIPQNLLSYYLVAASKLKIKINVSCQVKTINEDSVELYINHKTKNLDYISLISNIRSGVKYKFLPEARIIDCNLFIYDPDVVSNNKIFYDIVTSGFYGEIYMVGDALEISNLSEEIKSAYFVGNNI